MHNLMAISLANFSCGVTLGNKAPLYKRYQTVSTCL